MGPCLWNSCYSVDVESEQAPGVGDGQGGLACCSPGGRKESDTTERWDWPELIHVSSSQRSWPKIAVVWPAEHSVITLYVTYDAFSSMGRMHGSRAKWEEPVVASITALPKDPRATSCFQSYNLGSAGLAVSVPKMGPLFPDMWQKFHWTGNWDCHLALWATYAAEPTSWEGIAALSLLRRRFWWPS